MRCTVGEISDALERAWGRHTASSGVAPGYYVTEREAAAMGAWRSCSQCGLCVGMRCSVYVESDDAKVNPE